MHLDELEKAMDNYNNSIAREIKETSACVQRFVKCCGVEKYTDWEQVMGGDNVPDSCCKVETEGCGKGFNVEEIYTEGCLATLKAKILDNSGIAIRVGIGISVLIFLGVLIGCSQAKAMKF